MRHHQQGDRKQSASPGRTNSSGKKQESKGDGQRGDRSASSRDEKTTDDEDQSFEGYRGKFDDH